MNTFTSHTPTLNVHVCTSMFSLCSQLNVLNVCTYLRRYLHTYDVYVRTVHTYIRSMLVLRSQTHTCHYMGSVVWRVWLCKTNILPISLCVCVLVHACMHVSVVCTCMRASCVHACVRGVCMHACVVYVCMCV